MKFCSPRSRLIIPEVVQTSAMDCGPASLKCVLEGFGIPVSYGRLREACQTDVDGTSIDTVEEVAGKLGLEAEQIMLPADYLLMPAASALPAIVVVRLPSGITHFVVAWRRFGRFVQVMDPATGRRWPNCEQFISSIYIHSIPVASATWRAWAESDQFLAPLRHKLSALGVCRRTREAYLSSAASTKGWVALAALEAATRAVEAMVRSKGPARGREASRILEQLFQRACQNPGYGTKAIPSEYWSVSATPQGSEGQEQILLHGAVLVHLRGPSRLTESKSPGTSYQITETQLSPELTAALKEPRERPGRDLIRFLRADGVLTPVVLFCALFVAAAGVIVEAILFRSLLDLGPKLHLSGHRLGAMCALLFFLGGLLVLEFPIAAGLLRMGRHLESLLRIAFLEKIPRLGDRYFHSRLNSDMAERSHSIHRIRLLPDLGGQFLRSGFELTLTVAGIIWLDPYTAPIAILSGVFALLLPFLAQPLLIERDLRLRSHVGALGRCYLDAFLGLVAIRSHGAERALRRQHDSLLREWTRASLARQRLVVWIEGIQFIAGFGLAAWLLLDHVQRFGESGGALLLVYWSLSLPVLGQDVALIAWQYPAHRNTTLRLLEPIGAPHDPEPSHSEALNKTSGPYAGRNGVSVDLQSVCVRAAGHTILRDINLAVEAGGHVAIVGMSGAGKSSLVGVLLGWHRAAEGRILIDGAALDGAVLENLRQVTAWVEPAVQLWNRSLFDNLCYGAPAGAVPTSSLLELTDLRQLLEKLPQGMQTELGEGGSLASGGEGQRVRLARAMLKPSVRLAILDEPFRGLDRHQRSELMTRARDHWQDITLLCITHDVSETLAFPRVIVVERGSIVEDGLPAELAGRAGSRYRAMLEAEDAVREDLWSHPEWRHLSLEHGRLTEALRARVTA